MIKVALVDDHTLLRKGLCNLINSFDGFQVIFEADNGKGLVERLEQHQIPDVVLLDITMPVMNGYETAEWLKNNHPNIKVIVLSMLDNELSVIRMIKYGAKGYILKDSEPSELKMALQHVMQKGYYANELLNGKMIDSFQKFNVGRNKFEGSLHLNEKELHFLQLCATDMTYKEIADAMDIRPRTVENYKTELCDRLDVRSRIGLVLYAIRNNIVEI